MQHTAVKSRDIAIVGYDAASSTLEIAFRNGGVYRYNGVPQQEYQNLMAAPSHGTYFNQNIKDKYSCTKVS